MKLMKKLIPISLLLILLLITACTPTNTTPPKIGPPPTQEQNNIILGAEYAFPGQAKALSGMGITGIKFYPETYTMWDVMQTGPDKPINFTNLDAMVKEYQTAGFSNIVFGLRHQSTWGSINAQKLLVTNPLPKPEYEDDYEKWFSSIIERYDKDGNNDMPGLLYPINTYEIGVEFSTYEPESVNAYIIHLTKAYKIAHDNNQNARVAHVAFLTLGALDKPITKEQYENSFNTLQDKTHTLEDMRIILDHPEIFDVLNVHSLGDPKEIERIVEFYTQEMTNRGYNKQILISDTAPTPFIAYGPADSCTGKGEGAVFHPVTETDRCRTAEYFKKLLRADTDTIAWTRAFIAKDTFKRAIIAAHQNITQIDLAFTEDIEILKGLTRAGAGNQAWGGILITRITPGNEQRTVIGANPVYYTIQQLQKNIKGYKSITKISTQEGLYLYEIITKQNKKFWIAWVDNNQLILPGDQEPTINLSLGDGNARIEPIITIAGKTTPESTITQKNSIIITTTPIFIYEQE